MASLQDSHSIPPPPSYEDITNLPPPTVEKETFDPRQDEPDDTFGDPQDPLWKNDPERQKVITRCLFVQWLIVAVMALGPVAYFLVQKPQAKGCRQLSNKMLSYICASSWKIVAETLYDLVCEQGIARTERTGNMTLLWWMKFLQYLRAFFSVGVIVSVLVGLRSLGMVTA